MWQIRVEKGLYSSYKRLFRVYRGLKGLYWGFRFVLRFQFELVFSGQDYGWVTDLPLCVRRSLLLINQTTTAPSNIFGEGF